MADTSLDKRSGLFAAPRAAPEADASYQNDSNILNTRLRVSEERYSDLRRKLQLIEQNLLAHQKKVVGEFKNVQADILEMKRSLRVIEDRVIMAIKELQLTARKEDVDVLKRYVEMWDPLRFVTQDQVEKLIDEKLGRHTEDMHEE